MDNATTFGAQADVYRAACPSYPGALFDWIVSQAPATEAAWDHRVRSGSHGAY